MDRIVARYRWTYHLQSLGANMHEQTRRKDRILSYGFLISVGVIAGAAAWEGNLKTGAAFIAVLILVGMIAASLVFLIVSFISPRLRKWQFERRPEAGADIEWTFTETEISAAAPWGTFVAPWSSYFKITGTPYGFLFFSNPQAPSFIPNDAFETPDHVDALKALAREHARNFNELP